MKSKPASWLPDDVVAFLQTNTQAIEEATGTSPQEELFRHVSFCSHR